MFNSTSPKTGSGCEGTQGETGNEIFITVKAFSGFYSQLTEFKLLASAKYHVCVIVTRY